MDNREIDKLVAEKVFNWEWREREFNPRVFGLVPPTYHVWWDKTIDNVPPLCLTEKTNYNTNYTPPFSTDISAAWHVAEMLEHRFGCDVNIDIRRKSMDKVWTGERWERKRYYVTISGGKLGYDSFNCSFTIYDNSPCLAICLAALKAIESQVEQEAE